jgi:hypothetical protein
MKKTLIFGLFALLLLPSFVSADISADVAAYWTFDDDNTTGINPADVTGNGHGGTGTGVTAGATGKILEAFTYDGADDYITVSNSDTSDFSTSDFTMAGWFKFDNLGVADRILWSSTQATISAGTINYDALVTSAGSVGCQQRTSSSANKNNFWSYGSVLNTSQYHHIACVYDTTGSKLQLYVNGVLRSQNNDTYTPAARTPSALRIGMRVDSYGDFDGEIDEVGRWDSALSSSEISDLYNDGDGLSYYCFGGGCGATPKYAEVQVFDQYDNSTLNGLTVYIGSDSNTTDGSGRARVYDFTGLNYTVDGGSNYFNVSGTATENATVSVETYGALLNLSAYNVEGSNVLSFNLSSPETSNTTTNGWQYLLLPPATTTAVNVTAADYYLGEFNITTTGKDTSSQNLTGLYQTIVTINATNAYSGATLSNFTGWLYNNATTYNQTFNTTGNESTVFALLGTYTAYIDVFGYSIGADNYNYGTFTTNTETVSFSLYSENSININIYNEETSALITDNVTVTLSGNASEQIYYTTTGGLFLENITDGNYSLKFNADNYTQRTYEVTVADRSSQNVNAYLSPGTDTVTFNVVDYDSSADIEGATMVQERLINSTWTTTESKTTDITGRAQFSYTLGAKYRFTVSATGYDTKVFELDPVIFTSYVIRLEKDLTLDKDLGLFDVNILYYPKTLTNDDNNTFTFTFGSAGGSLESYGYSLDYPGGSISGSGTNANGQTFLNSSFLITGAAYGDYGNLTYWYDSTLGDNKTFTAELLIQNTAGNNTAAGLKSEDYGLGTLDKILIAVVITLLFAGVLTLFSNALAGLAGGALVLGYFTYIDFLSIWVVLPSLLLAVILLMRRTSE